MLIRDVRQRVSPPAPRISIPLIFTLQENLLYGVPQYGPFTGCEEACGLLSALIREEDNAQKDG